jgi:hypothetical protein
MEALMLSNPAIETADAYGRGVQAGMYDNTPTGKQLCSQDMRRLRNAGVEHTGCRKVRTRTQTEHMEETILDILHTYHPQTVRQIFYQMTVHKLVDKTEAGYRKIADILCSIRRGDRLDYDFIVDNTRGIAQPMTFSNVHEPLTTIVDTYRKSLWNGIPCRLQVWLEKDALASVIEPITSKYDVPLFVARGYSSLSFLHNEAVPVVDEWADQDLPITVLHLGDFDPSGRDAARQIREALSEFSPDAELNFVELAVTVEQIDQWNLPSRPNKEKDPRTKKFEGRYNRESTELDAIPAQTLRQIIEDAIKQHMSDDVYDRLMVQEAGERDQLARMVGLAPDWIYLMHDYRSGDRPDPNSDDLPPPPSPLPPPVPPVGNFNIMGA